jgi:hypothetical protein
MKSVFLITLLFVLALLIGCKYTEPETYLIPNGYKGKVNIIFNQKNGEKPVYESGRRIYKIPLNGILLTQFNDEHGLVNHKYFYVDSIGNKKPLEIFEYSYNKDGTIKWLIADSTLIGIFGDGTAGVYGNSKFKFQEFVVCNYANLDVYNNESANNKFLRKLQSILNSDFQPDTLILK